MSWARVDDRFAQHPKVIGLDLAAVGLWTLCLCDARARGDDQVPALLPARYAGADADRLTGLLADRGLWEPTETGWRIHDAKEYGPPPDLAEKRARAGSKGAQSRWQPNGKRVANARQTDGSGTPVPAPVDVSPKGATSLAPAKPSRPRNQLFDALAEECGMDPGAVTKSEGGWLGTAAAEIAKAGGSVEEIRVRAGRWRREHPEIALTPSTLAKHWTRLATERAVVISHPASAAERRVQEREAFLARNGLGLEAVT